VKGAVGNFAIKMRAGREKCPCVKRNCEKKPERH
jgi:hypothetical protein